MYFGLIGPHLSPDEPAGAPDPEVKAAAETKPASDDVVREDGHTIPAGLAKALKEAGRDPLTISMSDALAFANEGNKTFYKRHKAEQAIRQSVEGELNEIKGMVSGLALDKVLGAEGQTAEGKQLLEGLKGKVERLAGVEGTLAAAFEAGLVPEDVLNAIRSANPDHAKGVFKLIAELQQAKGKDQSAKAASVGADVTTPDKPKADEPGSFLKQFDVEHTNPAAADFVKNIINRAGKKPAPKE